MAGYATSRAIYAVLTDPGQKILLGHHGWVGGTGTWEGKLEVGLLGLATAVEKVRVGGACWGLGTAATNPTPRTAALRRVVQLILCVLLEGKRAKEAQDLLQLSFFIYSTPPSLDYFS